MSPEEVRTLRTACRLPKQVRLSRELGPSGGTQIISAEGEGREYSAITVHLASRQGTLKTLLRHMGAWLRPNGLFLVVLGPDGVGKSTTIQRLQFKLQMVLGPCRKERWRPGLIREVTPDTGNRMPHAKPLRGGMTSVISILGLALDFSVGYIASAYPAMVRSETIIFDRYFHDLLIDPKRYRYAGPMWLPRLISRFIPPRDAIFIVLDANEELILSRKKELPRHELKRQRLAYSTFASRVPNSMIIDTEKPVDDVVMEIMDRIIDIMSRRNSQRAETVQHEDLTVAPEPTGATRLYR